jgi:predicted XRE-type DNA-binding protein
MIKAVRPFRPLLWVASSKRDYGGFPERVQDSFGCAADREGEEMMARKVKVEASSGNIFADLGLPDADTHFLKAQIVSEIYRLTNERKLTQARAGKLMGISQPEVSRMFKGQFREYSVDRLMAFLTGFDRDIEIVVKPHKKGGKAGRITFSPLSA